jgi:Zn-dependent protease
MASGVILTAVAGPLSNLVLAALCRVVLLVLATVWPSLLEGQSGVAFLLSQAVAINLSLAIFNLLPLPPLDGSRVVEGFIPFTWRGTWDRIASLGVPLLLVLFLLPSLVAGVNPLGWAVGSLVRLLGIR